MPQVTGRVCEKHQEYCPDGNCRWCEPSIIEGVHAVPKERYGVFYWGIANIDWNTAELKRARNAQDKSML